MFKHIALTVSLSLSFVLAACGEGQHENTLGDAIDFSTQELGAAPSGCTRPAVYWKANLASWPVDPAMMICRHTIDHWLQTNPVQGDVWHVLVRHTIVATLNANIGATPPAALHQAKALLQPCSIAPADQALAFSLAQQLDAYNTGRAAPGSCP